MTWAYLTEQGLWQPCSVWLAVRLLDTPAVVRLVEQEAKL